MMEQTYQFDMEDANGEYCNDRFSCREEDVPGYVLAFEAQGYTVYRVFLW